MDFTNSESDPSTNDETNRVEEEQVREEGKSNVLTGNGASPGKIFIGGLAKETSLATFNKYFGKYGEITDSVIMKDRRTGHPRGFGFVTYADPSVVDTVIEETHVINGKQVEIKRTIPKGAISGKDFKTKKIFVGGIPTSVDEDEFKDFFQKFGEVTEHQIMRDHSSNRSRGFGFITFESEKAVDDLLSKGNRLDFSGTQVEIKKAEPKKSSSGPPTKHFGDHKPQFGGSFGPYGDFGGGFGNSSYRAGGNFGRTGDYGGGYGRYGGNALGSFRDSSLSYSGRYGGGISRNYDLGGYGGINEAGYGGYGGAGYGNGYESAYGTGYGGTGGSVYGGRGGYGGAAGSRYHPYTR